MSQPKRYRPAIDDGSREPWMKESELGGYVEYADYSALQAENERLKDELIGYHKECDRLYEQAIDQQMAANVFENNGIILKAENERLRKAGDAMENELFRVILMELPGLEKEDINNQYIADWRAAKGVQP